MRAQTTHDPSLRGAETLYMVRGAMRSVQKKISKKTIYKNIATDKKRAFANNCNYPQTLNQKIKNLYLPPFSIITGQNLAYCSSSKLPDCSSNLFVYEFRAFSILSSKNRIPGAKPYRVFQTLRNAAFIGSEIFEEIFAMQDNKKSLSLRGASSSKLRANPSNLASRLNCI